MDENLKIGTREIGTIADDEDNPDEYIGFLKFSTTGEVLVPRDWLLEQWNNHNLPKDILPTQVTNWQAFRRAIRYVEDDDELLNYEVYNSHYNQTFNCRFIVEKSGEEGSNVFIVYARTFIPEEIIGEEGGDYNQERVGYFNFYRPEDSDGYIVTEEEIDEDNAHYDALTELFDETRKTWHKMKKHHNYSDLQNILTGFRTKGNAVEVRRAVYFIPAHLENYLEGLQTVWGELNQFKSDGEEVRIDKSPVINMSEQRELIESRVHEKLKDIVGEVVGEIIQQWEDSADETADEAANRLLEELQDSGAEEISANYNQLLNARLSVKEILEEQREELGEEAEEVIENVINQEEIGDYE